MSLLWMLICIGVLLAAGLWWFRTRRSDTAAPEQPSPGDPVQLVSTKAPAALAIEPVQAIASDKDVWEDWSTAAIDPWANGQQLVARLQIDYLDASGQRTRRDIDTERYALSGSEGIVHAFCHLRQARRAFNLTRINAVVDRDSGEAIGDLPAWLRTRYASSDAGVADHFMAEHDALLVALFVVAKADGAFRAREKDILRALCAKFGLHEEGALAEVLDRMAKWAVPSAIAYGKALRSIAQRPPGYALQVLQAAESMVATDKTAHETEHRAVERMRKELGIEPQRG